MTNLVQPESAITIPVIDLSDSFSSSLALRSEVAAKIRKACCETGFFYVSNHGVPEEAIDSAAALSRRFFGQPDAAKLPLLGQGGYGYEPPRLQILDETAPPDLKEGFMMSASETPMAQYVSWPEDMPEFREGLESYDRHMRQLGCHIMRCIALSLDLPEDYFDEGFSRPTSSVRVLHYAPRPRDSVANQIGAGAHTDWGAITILHQDEIGGLEVQTADGAWVAATPIAGTFVVNLGDMIRRWTNDRYSSTMHRVLPPEGDRHRYSIATFFNPYDQYEVACVPTCRIEGDEPRYPPCTVGEHIQEMMRKTYEKSI